LAIIQSLKSNDAIVEEVDLIDLKRAYVSKVNPLEGCAQRLDAQLVHVEANLRLVHLEQIFEQLAQTDNRLWGV